MESLVRTALGDRATLVRVAARSLASPRVSSTQSARDLLVPSLPRRTILVGACLDPELASRLIDVGPSAENLVLAKQFQAFWGAQSSLRRFKDGKICEALVWESAPASRHTVPDRYVWHLHAMCLLLVRTWLCL